MVVLCGVGRRFCATNGLNLALREFLDKKSLAVSAIASLSSLDWDEFPCKKL